MVFNYFVRRNLTFSTSGGHCMNWYVSLSLNLFRTWLLSSLIGSNLLLILWKLPDMKLS